MKVVSHNSSWTCARCGRSLPWTPEFFHARKGTVTGLSYTCKECARAKNAEFKEKYKVRDGATREKCDRCGREFWKSAGRKSCLCHKCSIYDAPRAVPKHGLYGHPLYQVWAEMKTRCANPRNKAFHNYGGRGIVVCDEWREFVPFYEWANSSGWSEDLTIERKDVNLGYSPENCTWIPLAEQPFNRRNTVRITAWGETMALSLWFRDPRVACRNRHTVMDRIERGASPEDALSAPPQKRHCLSDAEKRQIRESWRNGTSMTDIGIGIGVSQPTVCKYLKSVGLR